MNIGILSFHGDCSEHITATEQAGKNLGLKISIVPVRTKKELHGLDGLIIPGGESPTLRKLCERENMWEEMKKVKNIFGTCAGAILLEKMKLMDIKVDRNAYGRQIDSFEKTIKTKLGEVNAVFIRAPKIKSIGKNVSILSKNENEIVACEQKTNGRFYLATCFHPELTTTKFHEYFLKSLKSASLRL